MSEDASVGVVRRRGRLLPVEQGAFRRGCSARMRGRSWIYRGIYRFATYAGMTSRDCNPVAKYFFDTDLFDGVIVRGRENRCGSGARGPSSPPRRHKCHHARDRYIRARCSSPGFCVSSISRRAPGRTGRL